MKRIFTLLALALAPASALAQTSPAAASVTVPREKVSLTCTDSYFKSQRQNFLLADELYPSCVLKMPLALRQRWPGRRTFYVIPRLSASLHAVNPRGEGRWLPLAPLVTPGADPLHTTLDSRGYQAVELRGKLGQLSSVAEEAVPDTVSVGGRLTVCAAPVYPGEAPCTTFEVTARYKVYTRAGSGAGQGGRR